MPKRRRLKGDNSTGHTSSIFSPTDWSNPLCLVTTSLPIGWNWGPCPLTHLLHPFHLSNEKKKCNSPKFQILLKVKTSFLSQIWGVSIFSVWSSTSLFLPSLLVQGIGRCVQSQGGGVRRKGLPRWECCNLPLVSCGTEKCSKLTFLKWPTFMDPSVISLGKHLTTALLRSISYLLPHMYV